MFGNHINSTLTDDKMRRYLDKFSSNQIANLGLCQNTNTLWVVTSYKLLKLPATMVHNGVS